MKKDPKGKTWRIIGIIILALLGGLIYLGITKLNSILSGLKPEVAAAIIIGVVTVFVSIFSLILSKHYENKALIRREHREKKVPVYEELIKFLFKIVFASRMGEEPPSEIETIQFFSEFTGKIIVWGDDDVLQKYRLFKTASLQRPNDEVSRRALIFLLENLFFAIRKDLGHKNKHLEQGDLLRLFVTDVDNQNPEPTPSSGG